MAKNEKAKSSSAGKTRAAAPTKAQVAASKHAKAASAPDLGDKQRQLKVAPYKSLKLQKKIKSPDDRVLGSFRLFNRAILALARNWPLFLGIIIIYALLSVILAGSLSVAGSSNLEQAKDNLSTNFGGFVTAIGLFTYLASSSGLGSSPVGGITQTVLIIFISLAIIWALRQVYIVGRERPPRIRDAFYEGMAQFTQFILVSIVLMLELIPLAIGALLYSVVVTNGIAVTTGEKSIFGAIFFLLAVASFYMLTSSTFALYIVTLKGMTPVKALKSAGQLVRYRRVRIFLKLLFIIVALIVISAIIIIPLAIWVTPFAPYAFFILTLIFLAIFHSYIYALYRELI